MVCSRKRSLILIGYIICTNYIVHLLNGAVYDIEIGKKRNVQKRHSIMVAIMVFNRVEKSRHTHVCVPYSS